MITTFLLQVSGLPHALVGGFFLIKTCVFSNTHQIMQNYFLTFKGTKESETENIELVCKNNGFNEIVIYMNEQHICLDKITAVRLQRELKRLIGNLKDEGGQK